MADKSDRKFWVVLLLTVIPVTDFLGANWFYMKHTMVGWIKIALCILLLIALIALMCVTTFNFLAAFVFPEAFVVTGVVIVVGFLWWIVDIFLVALPKRL